MNLILCPRTYFFILINQIYLKTGKLSLAVLFHVAHNLTFLFLTWAFYEKYLSDGMHLLTKLLIANIGLLISIASLFYLIAMMNGFLNLKIKK
jgi:hypothetical protein